MQRAAKQAGPERERQPEWHRDGGEDHGEKPQVRHGDQQRRAMPPPSQLCKCKFRLGQPYLCSVGRSRLFIDGEPLNDLLDTSHNLSC